MLPSRTISVFIARPWHTVYALAQRPETMAAWAAGLGEAFRNEGGRWIAETPGGPVEVRFTPPNDFGVLDHWVHLNDGQVVYVPLRVFANDGGAEVALTLFRQPGMADADFDRDAGLVARDLEALRRLAEA